MSSIKRLSKRLMLIFFAVLISCPALFITAQADYEYDAYEYRIDGSEITITGISLNRTAVTDIPDVIDGKPVTEIYLDVRENDEYRIESLHIPKYVTTIRTSVDCSVFKKCSVDEENPYFTCIDNVIFSKDKTTLVLFPSGITGSYTVPSGVETIMANAFAYSRLNKVILPDSLKEISAGAFYSCRSLANIQFPENLEEIWDNAFMDCIALSEITLPDSVTTLDMKAFCGCSALKKVTIGSGITEIPHICFNGCDALEEMVIPASVAEIAETAFFETETGQIPLKLIRGVPGSYAETYANRNNIEFLPIEDTTANGGADSSDVTVTTGAVEKNSFIPLLPYAVISTLSVVIVVLIIVVIVFAKKRRAV